MYINNYTLTRPYTKRIKTDNELTSTELTVRKNKISDYCQKRKKDFDGLYGGKYYFCSPENYVKLIDYHPYYHSTQISKDLEGINHNRIQRETSDEIKIALKQIRQIISVMTKKHKQELIDSQEFNDIIEELLEQGEYSRHERIDTYDFAQNMFYRTLKILIDNSAKPIQTHLVKSMQGFFDMTELASELGHKTKKTLVRPVVFKDTHTGKSSLRLSTKYLHKDS